MTTAAQRQQRLRAQLAAETYDPDEVVPRDSPLMKALHSRLELSPSPPPDIPLAQVSLSPPPINDFPRSNRLKIRPSAGGSLVAYLDYGRRPEIARAASHRAIPDLDNEIEGPCRGSSSLRLGGSLTLPEPRMHFRYGNNTVQLRPQHPAQERNTEVKSLLRGTSIPTTISKDSTSGCKARDASLLAQFAHRQRRRTSKRRGIQNRRPTRSL